MQRIIAEQEPPRPSMRLSTMERTQRTTVAQNRRMEPSALTRLFQGDLDWIVMKCLEKERARRYETASALAADLQRHLQSEPVTARPPTAAYRLQKAIRRNRMAFAAGGAVVLALVLGTMVSAWQAIRATNAEREQMTLRAKAEAAADQETAARRRAEDAQARERDQRQRAEASEQNAQQLLYAANMNLVQQAWEADNIGLIGRLLIETEDSPYRGFEWYYWQQQIHGELLTLTLLAAVIQASVRDSGAAVRSRTPFTAALPSSVARDCPERTRPLAPPVVQLPSLNALSAQASNSAFRVTAASVPP